MFVLDEPTTGLHPADVDRLMHLLHSLVDAGNTVIVIEHDMDVIAASDWVIDVGPGAGDEGGEIVAAGPPVEVARAPRSRTAPYLARALAPDGGRSLHANRGGRHASLQRTTSDARSVDAA
jgi:excinuclease ABC subunit A